MSVIPKLDEVLDKNMPRNLHNAAELFLRGMVDAAKNVQRNVADLLDIYSNNPDGKSNFIVGRGNVCWACGHCGIPKGGANNQKGNNIQDDLHKIPPDPCNNCGETEQVNWLKVTSSQPGVDAANVKKEELPWIETPPLSEEELKKKKEVQLLAQAEGGRRAGKASAGGT